MIDDRQLKEEVIEYMYLLRKAGIQDHEIAFSFGISASRVNTELKKLPHDYNLKFRFRPLNEILQDSIYLEEGGD